MNAFDAWFAVLRSVRFQPDRQAVDAAYEGAMAAAERVEHIEALFDALYTTFPPPRRWVEAARLRSWLQSSGPLSPAGLTLLMRLHVTLRDFPGFIDVRARVDDQEWVDVDAVWRRRFDALAARFDNRPFPDFAEPKVFGIGLSKSGTHSLNAAIEATGRISAHYANPYSGWVLSDEDAVLFDAMTDTPVCIMFELLYYRFPNSIFVYTRRPRSEWMASFLRHCERAYGTSNFEYIRKIPDSRRFYPHIGDFMNIDFGLYFRFPALFDAIDAYERRVFEFFGGKPSDRFLVLDVGQPGAGETLRGVLGAAPTSEPFPHENSSGARIR